MELTELERAWQTLDARLAGLEQHARDQRRHRALAGVRGRMRLLGLGQVIQLVVGLAIVLWAGPTWVAHWGEWPVVAYGIGVHVYGLALLIVALLQLFVVAWLDYRRPVATVQKRLLLLARVRVWGERWLLAIGFVAWVPLVFLLLALAGVDVWARSPLSVLLNLAVGLAMSAGVTWLSYRFRERFDRDATGRNLRIAREELADLAGDGR